MLKKKKCPSELCGHREFTDYSQKTCTPEPYCPECMKLLKVPHPWSDGSGEDFEESY